MTSLADLSEAALRWFDQRLRNFFTRSTNHGLGAFLLFALALTMFTFGSVHLWRISARDTELVERYFSTKTAFLTQTSYASVLTLILARMRAEPSAPGTSSWDLQRCDTAMSRECRFDEALFKRTQALVSYADSQWLQRYGGEQQPEHLETLPDWLVSASGCCSRSCPAADSRCNEVDIGKVLDVNIAGRSIGPVAPGDWHDVLCGEGTAENRSFSQQFLLAPATCAPDHLSDQFALIPGQSSDAVLGPATRSTGTLEAGTPAAGTPEAGAESAPRAAPDPAAMKSDWTAVRQYRIRRAELDGELFAMALDPLVADLEQAPSAERSVSSEVVAAYYITLDSYVRYWQRSQIRMASDMPNHRLHASARYIQSRLRTGHDPGMQTTLPYIDIAGAGIVWTKCAAVRGRSLLDVGEDLRPAVDGQPHSFVAGFLCVDYSLSDAGLNELLHRMNDNPLSRAVAVEAEATAEGTWHLTTSDRAPQPWMDSALKEAKSRLEERASSGESPDLDVIPLSTDDTKGNTPYLVLARRLGEHHLRFVLVTVHGIGPLGSRPQWMAWNLVFGFLAFGAWWSGSGSSKRLAGHEAQLARLRSLQVAVIETDHENHIVAANDRTEELVGYRLPTIGLRRREMRGEDVKIPFWSLFHENVVVGSPGASSDTPAEVIDAKQFDRRLLDGEVASFYLKVRRPDLATGSQQTPGKRWLRMNSAPIFLASAHASRRPGRNSLSGSFGILDPVEDAALVDRLESAIRSYQGGAFTPSNNGS